MSAVAASVAENFGPRLTPFEVIFVRTVLEHRGVHGQPALGEFSGALEVLRRYDEQCIANPGRQDDRAPRLGAEDMTALRAKAFLIFGTIRPTPAQWQRAQVALFGPTLCETCD
jgi:hypothetical protein